MGASALVISFGLMGCTPEAPPDRFITLRVLDQAGSQPTSPDLGVLVEVAANGGNAVQLVVEGGTQALYGGTIASNAGVATGCVNLSAVSSPVRYDTDRTDVGVAYSFVAAVKPDSTQAKLTATLGNVTGGLVSIDSSCSAFVPIGPSYTLTVSSVAMNAKGGAGGASSGAGGGQGGVGGMGTGGTK